MDIRLRRVLKLGAGLGQRHEAQFIDVRQLTAGDLFLEARETLFIAGLATNGLLQPYRFLLGLRFHGSFFRGAEPVNKSRCQSVPMPTGSCTMSLGLIGERLRKSGCHVWVLSRDHNYTSRFGFNESFSAIPPGHG